MTNATLLGITGCITVALLTALVVGVRMAFMAGQKAGYVEGISDSTKDMLKRALDSGRVSPESYEAFCLEGWNGPLPYTVWGFVHLQSKLAGEAGEFAEHFGKSLRDDPGTLENFQNGYIEFTPERRKAMLKELGDIAWYVAVLAKELGSSFLEVLTMNIVKLRDRRARGVSKGNGDDR